MTRIADTSVLYALFDEEDVHHEAARRALEDPEPVLVPAEILVETIDLLAYRIGHRAGRDALEALLALPHVAIADPVPFTGVQDVHRRAGGKLSLADSFVVQTCRVLGAAPLTFDRAIRAAARA